MMEGGLFGFGKHYLTLSLPRVTLSILLCLTPDDLTLSNARWFYSVLRQTILLVKGRPFGSERVKKLHDPPSAYQFFSHDFFL